MSLTRECVIRYLTEMRQASPAIIANYPKVHLAEVMAVVTDSDDFERIAPAPGAGDCWHWRLSPLARDITVRRAACAHLRDAVAPPQSKPLAFTKERHARDGMGSALAVWLRANPGSWTIRQIAAARGVAISTVAAQIGLLGAVIAKHKVPGQRRALAYSLAPDAAPAASTPLSTAS